MTTIMRPLGQDLSSTPDSERTSAQSATARSSSSISIVTAENSAPKPYTGNPRRNRQLSKTNFDETLRCRTMIKFLHSRANANGYFGFDQPTRPLGVIARRSTGGYMTEPRELSPLLVQAVENFGPRIAFTMSTETTEALFDAILDDYHNIELYDGTPLQIIESLSDIVRGGIFQVGKPQFAALLKSERVLLVWHDDVDQVLLQAAKVEESLLGLILGTSPPSTLDSKKMSVATGSSLPSALSQDMAKRGKAGFETPIFEAEDLGDLEQAKESFARPTRRNGSYLMGLSMFFLVFSIFGYTTSHLVLEWMTDGDLRRFYFIIAEPLTLAVAMFFSLSLVTYAFQLFAPITGLRTNSRFFSAKKPNIRQAYTQGFSPPRITIQMAVYKESLELVVIPTVRSLLAAVSHYESQGGKANIFICDDGLGYLLHDDPAAARSRIDFYAAHNIGWVARPGNGENDYIRTGRFKKASNMNFCLNFTNKVERTLKRLLLGREQAEKEGPIYVETLEEDSFYRKALAEELSRDSRVKAEGNIRMGEIILMVDSDTRVPMDCLIYGAAEMFLSPEVAILQHSTSVVQVSGDFFENGAAYFAKMCYTQIRFTVSNGECSPFVGHNAFVRWAAVQDIGVQTSDPEEVVYWSEHHISEDFQMGMRLQTAGWITRYAAYHKEDFKEMVSLTIYDEISRWERYSYGDSEMIFNPIWTWLWRTPFTKLFRNFLFCDMHLSSKLSIISYMTSYYAIGSGFFYTIANYILVGLYPDKLDKFYMQSWSIFLTVVLVFWLLGNISLAVLRWRLGERTLWSSLWENFKWQPMYCFFFYGLSFHINKSLLAHIIGYEMTWEMTKKEVEDSNFWKEIPKIAKSFVYMYLVMIPMAGGMIYMAFFAPMAWRITEPVAVVPMALMIVCHCSLPFALNPYIITAVDQFRMEEPKH